MAKKQAQIPPHLQPWIEARRRFHLSHAHVQMARELGMNPKKLGKLNNHDQEPWKLPLREFIGKLYFKRFGKEWPDFLAARHGRRAPPCGSARWPRSLRHSSNERSRIARARHAKTDRLDTGSLKRVFIGWLRGEPDHCHMAAIPTLAEEDANPPREGLVRERTRIVNRMKSCLARFGIRNFKPTLRKAPERLATLATPEGVPLPPNTLLELRRDMARLRFVMDQIKEVEEARAQRLEQAPQEKTHAMVRLIARVTRVTQNSIQLRGLLHGAGAIAPQHLLRVVQGAPRAGVDSGRPRLLADGSDRLHGLRAGLGPDELLGGDRHHQPVLGYSHRRRRHRDLVVGRLRGRQSDVLVALISIEPPHHGPHPSRIAPLRRNH